MQQQNDFNYHAKLSESEINNKEEIYQIEEESSLVENTVSQNIDSNHSINTSNVLKNSNEKIILFVSLSFFTISSVIFEKELTG